VDKISLSTVIMRTCKHCADRNRPEKCRVGAQSMKCVECIRTGYQCDLAPFSTEQWLRLKRQRKQKSMEAREALAKWSRLQAEVDQLERKEQELVEGELRNIADLEADEATSAGGPNTEDFLLDVESEQLVLEDDFDWSALGFVPGGTVAEASGNPEGVQ